MGKQHPAIPMPRRDCALRDRQQNVLSPQELAKKHAVYRQRIIMGPTYRVDMWALLEVEPALTPAEVVRPFITWRVNSPRRHANGSCCGRCSGDYETPTERPQARDKDMLGSPVTNLLVSASRKRLSADLSDDGRHCKLSLSAAHALVLS